MIKLLLPIAFRSIRKLSLRYIIFIPLMGLGRSYCAQSQSMPDSIVQLLNNYQLAWPQEKIYVHVDRAHYATGDTLWLKAYALDGSSSSADSVSRNIYVQLIQKENGKVISELLLENIHGYACGSINIADSLSKGIYVLRAHTQWMRNFPENTFFHKDIFIQNKHEFRNQLSPTELDQIRTVADLQFFPEGGNLVAGMQNRAAFKAINQYGRGTDFKAFVISSHHDTVATISSQHLGMGTFIFKPSAGEIYYASIEKSKTGKEFYLPKIDNHGYTFFVDNLSSKDIFKVIARSNNPVKDKPILIVHQRNEVLFSIQSEKEGNSFAWSLSKSQIKNNGVVHLTLFSGTGIPQCERLIYNVEDKPLQLSVTPDKTEYKPREKVELSIHSTDANNDPVSGNFSLSVSDSRQVFTDSNGENIVNYLFLSSEVDDLGSNHVNGTVEEPAYYFDQSNANALVHLDILLMTQGWRRFSWRDVLDTKQKAPRFNPETGLTVSGKATLPNGKDPGKPVDISLMYDTVFLQTKSDASGKFVFAGIRAKDQSQIFLQGTRDNGNRHIRLSIAPAQWPTYEPQSGLVDPFFFNEENLNGFFKQQAHLEEIDQKQAGKESLLKEVVVTSKKLKEPDSRRTMYEEMGAQTVVVNQQMCSGYTSVLQIIQGRVAGLEVNCQGSNCTAKLTRINRFRGNIPPTVLVDGIVTNMDHVNSLSPCNVESIDVITSPVTILNAPGLISILTKGGSNGSRDWSSAMESSPGTLVTKIRGYDSPRQFYSPKYDLFESPSSNQIRDVRATLYWNPVIKTDSNGNAKVIFWNSDEVTSIHIGIEGLSANGEPGVATNSYKIK